VQPPPASIPAPFATPGAYGGAPRASPPPSVGTAERAAGTALTQAARTVRRLAGQTGLRLPSIEPRDEAVAAFQQWHAAREASATAAVGAEAAARRARRDEHESARAAADDVIGAPTPYAPRDPLRRRRSPTGAADFSSATSAAASAAPDSPSSARRAAVAPSATVGVAAALQLMEATAAAARSVPAPDGVPPRGFASYAMPLERAMAGAVGAERYMGRSRHKHMQARLSACHAAGRLASTGLQGLLGAGAGDGPMGTARSRRSDAIAGMLLAKAPAQHIVATRLATRPQRA